MGRRVWEKSGLDYQIFNRRHDDAIPARMIAPYQVKVDTRPNRWLAGMTLDPAEVAVVGAINATMSASSKNFIVAT